MSRGYFTGKMIKPSGSMEFVSTSKKNDNVLILNASIVAGNNREFVKLFGFGQRPCKFKDEDGNNVEVAWEDRFDAEVLKKVPYWYKTRINVTGEQKEFLSQWDAIKYLDDHFDEYKDRRLVVTCDGEKNEYQGKISNQYRIKSIRLAEDNEKDKLEYKTIMYWNKDGIDDTDWDSDHILYIDGYEESYVKEEKKNKLFPQRFVFNCQKVNFDDEEQKGAAEFRLNMLKTKEKTYQKLAIECRIIAGAEEDDSWSEDDLTDKQKEMVAFGIKKVEDFKPAGTRYGEFVREIRIVNPDLSVRGYENGAISSDLTEDEFNDFLYATPIDPEEGFIPIPENDDTIDDLFA